jgi:uncharacterized protein (TIGR03437 family)
VNVAAGGTVTPSPATVSLTAAAGTTTTVQQAVQLTTTGGTPAFTTSVTTTSGNQWLSTVASATTLPATVTVVANPTGLTTGTYTGSVSILVQNSVVATIPVTLVVNTGAALQLSPTSLTFAYQTTSAGPPAAQSIQVTSGGAPLNWTVNATSQGNWLQVGSASGTTPGTLSVTVNPTGLAPGNYTGTISVVSAGATNSPQTVTVALSVTTPATPVIGSITNAASFAPTVAVPGLIFTVFGSDLGPATALSGQVAQGSLGTSVGETRVLFDGIPAPIVYASAGQVSGVVPFEIFGRLSTRMQVEYRGQRSRELELRVADTAPGIFTVGATGSGPGAILNQNGGLNSAANPESRGNVIVLYATGMGQTNPSSATGHVGLATELSRPLTNRTVSIGGREAQLLYAGAAPGLVAGAMQINVRIPTDAPTGSAVPVELQIGNAVSQGGVTVAVQ